jgi:hypothetical protein
VGAEIEHEIYAKLGNLAVRKFVLILFWFYVLLTIVILRRFRSRGSGRSSDVSLLGPDSLLSRWLAKLSGGRRHARHRAHRHVRRGTHFGLIVIATLLAMQVTSTPSSAATPATS